MPVILKMVEPPAKHVVVPPMPPTSLKEADASMLTSGSGQRLIRIDSMWVGTIVWKAVRYPLVTAAVINCSAESISVGWEVVVLSVVPFVAASSRGSLLRCRGADVLQALGILVRSFSPAWPIKSKHFCDSTFRGSSAMPPASPDASESVYAATSPTQCWSRPGRCAKQ